MDLYIEGTPYYFHGGDLGLYLRELVNELQNINFENFYTIKREINIDNDYESENENEIIIPVKDSRFSILNILNKKTSIYHCFNNGFTIPDYGDFLKVSSIYSLLPIYFEDLVKERYSKAFYEKVPKALINSNNIVTSSESIKNQILENFNIDDRKIKVIYPGVNSYYRPIDKEFSKIYIKSKFSINREFLLYIGELNSRKRLKSLLQVFKYISTIKEDSILIMSFTQSYYDEEAVAEIKSFIYLLELDTKVMILNNLNISDKLNLYNSCSAFIDLSIYEGLNINILEAFLCRCKIIASPIEYYHEILADYPFYLNIDNINLNNLNIYDFTALDTLIDYIFKTKTVYKLLAYKPFYQFNIEAHVAKLLSFYKEVERGQL